MTRTQPMHIGFFALLSTLALVGQGQAGERSPGSSDTSRRVAPEHKYHTTDRGYLSAGRPDRTLQEQVDPSVRQFWSDKCVSQRAAGRSHTGDCDNPAYSGGGYGWVDPYRYPRRRPAYQGGNTVIINRGGTVVVPRQYGSRPSGALMPLPRH